MQGSLALPADYALHCGRVDVRCEQCRTEYAIDDEEVTDFGVTVKCPSCSHLFRVRKRVHAVDAQSGERLWMVRNALGEIRRFRELTVLQRWIVERQVDAADEISRTGDNWRTLGDIAELKPFFDAAGSGPKKETVPGVKRGGKSANAAPGPSDATPPPMPIPSKPSKSGVRKSRSEPEFARDVPRAALSEQLLPRPDRPTAQFTAKESDKGSGLIRAQASSEGIPDEQIVDLTNEVSYETAPKRWLWIVVAIAVAAGGAAIGVLFSRSRASKKQTAPVAQGGPSNGATAPQQPDPALSLDSGGMQATSIAPPTQVDAAAIADAAVVVDASAVDAAATPESYSQLVARANKLSENGRSEQAIELYRAALSTRSRGVEALIGLGYAYLDRKQFSRAEEQFEEALAVSGGAEDALMGIAETYKSQGKKEAAIAAYRRYLARFGNGSRAGMARRNIDMLGGDPDETESSGSNSSGSSEGAAPKEPAGEPEPPKSETPETPPPSSGSEPPGGEPTP